MRTRAQLLNLSLDRIGSDRRGGNSGIVQEKLRFFLPSQLNREGRIADIPPTKISRTIE